MTPADELAVQLDPSACGTRVYDVAADRDVTVSWAELDHDMEGRPTAPPGADAVWQLWRIAFGAATTMQEACATTDYAVLDVLGVSESENEAYEAQPVEDGLRIAASAVARVDALELLLHADGTAWIFLLQPSAASEASLVEL